MCAVRLATVAGAYCIQRRCGRLSAIRYIIVLYYRNSNSNSSSSGHSGTAACAALHAPQHYSTMLTLVLQLLLQLLLKLLLLELVTVTCQYRAIRPLRSSLAGARLVCQSTCCKA
jgi:hypothetical protein